MKQVPAHFSPNDRGELLGCLLVVAKFYRQMGTLDDLFSSVHHKNNKSNSADVRYTATAK
jgi:hypothetical protein